MDLLKKRKNHFKEEHRRSAIATYLKEIVYGGNDGIVTTFAVVAGFNGAQSDSHIATYSVFTVLLFGVANLFGDGTSMGLGNFLSLRSEKDYYKGEKEREAKEISDHPQSEKEETLILLQEKGFTKEQSVELTKIYATNEKYWVEFMMNNELELPNPEGENPYITAIFTFIAFVIFGSIPLLPYIFGASIENSFIQSALSSLLALILLGVLRWKITRESILRSVLEIVAVGTIAGLVAYLVGTFFRL